MSRERTTITVRTSVVGFHRWPAASGSRDYLARLHRHLFSIEATLGVRHDDRDVEFHDLLELITQYLAKFDPDGTAARFGSWSCETIARSILDDVLMTCAPDAGYWRVDVSEDGENGATIVREEDADEVAGNVAGRNLDPGRVDDSSAGMHKS